MSPEAGKETIEEFLARGGVIQVVEPSAGSGPGATSTEPEPEADGEQCVCCGMRKRHRIWCLYSPHYVSQPVEEPKPEPTAKRPVPPKNPARSIGHRIAQKLCLVCAQPFVPPKRGFGRFTCQSCREKLGT